MELPCALTTEAALDVRKQSLTTSKSLCLEKHCYKQMVLCFCTTCDSASQPLLMFTVLYCTSRCNYVATTLVLLNPSCFVIGTEVVPACKEFQNVLVRNVCFRKRWHRKKRYQPTLTLHSYSMLLCWLRSQNVLIMQGSSTMLLKCTLKRPFTGVFKIMWS